MRKYGYAYCDRFKVDALLAHVQQEGAALADPTGARARMPLLPARLPASLAPLPLQVQHSSLNLPLSPALP